MPGYFSDADELYDLINGWDGNAGNPTLWVQTCNGTVAASLKRRGGPIPANQRTQDDAQRCPVEGPLKLLTALAKSPGVRAFLSPSGSDRPKTMSCSGPQRRLVQ